MCNFEKFGIFGIFIIRKENKSLKKEEKIYYFFPICLLQSDFTGIYIFKSSFEVRFTNVERHKRKKKKKKALIRSNNYVSEFILPVETLLGSFSRIATIFFSFTASLEKPLIPRSYSLLARNPRG